VVCVRAVSDSKRTSDHIHNEKPDFDSRSLCAINSQSLRNRCAIALHSLRNRCALALHSSDCFAIAAQSLCYRFAIAQRSLCNCFAIAAQSLRNRPTFAAQSVWCDVVWCKGTKCLCKCVVLTASFFGGNSSFGSTTMMQAPSMSPNVGFVNTWLFPVISAKSGRSRL
jgi:hypothetical protein